MPHLAIEYSANLRSGGDIPGLLPKLAKCLIEFRADGAAVYPAGGVRVRAYEAADYCVADGAADAAFVHAAEDREGANARDDPRDGECPVRDHQGALRAAIRAPGTRALALPRRGRRVRIF
jgi:hypothetical protein